MAIAAPTGTNGRRPIPKWALDNRAYHDRTRQLASVKRDWCAAMREKRLTISRADIPMMQMQQPL
jgi:hypothetical protein